MPVSINGSGSITGVSSLTQLTKLGVTGILTATDFSGPSGGAADFPMDWQPLLHLVVILRQPLLHLLVIFLWWKFNSRWCFNL